MKRMVFIDPSIADFSGHYLEYALSVLKQANKNGYECILATNYKFSGTIDQNIKVMRVFKYTFWDVFGMCPYLCDFGSSHSKSNYSHLKKFGKITLQRIRVNKYKKNLKKLLEKINISDEDIIFFPTICHLELLAMAEIVAEMQITYGSIHVLFRRPIFKYKRKEWIQEKNNPFVKDIKDKFLKTRKIGLKKLYFYSDTKELAEQYNSLNVYEFEVLPIPHGRENKHKNSEGNVKIGYLGGARSEKGFGILPIIVKNIHTRNVEYYIQSNIEENSLEIINAYSELRNYSREYGNLILFNELSDAEYEEYLEKMDIILLLYDPVAYSARSSGIFVEAVTSGSIILTMQGTWMAEQMLMFEDKYDLKIGEVCHGTEEVVDRLIEILEHMQNYQKDISRVSSMYYSVHNPQHFLEIVEKKKEF